MGKARKKRPQRVRHEPIAPRLTQEETVQHSGLIADLSSLSETKRESTLALISSITRFNSRLVSPELLAKLHLRLMDAVPKVRVLAANALRNIATEASMVGRLIQAGTPGAIVSILASEMRPEGPWVEYSLPLCVHLVHTLTNIL